MTTSPRAPAFAAVLTIPGIPPDLWRDPGNILAFDNLLDAWGAERERAFDRDAFLARYINTNAPAITDDDIADAATRLNVSTRHIKALMKVESNGKSFDDKGRPIILFEPHIFHDRTSGKYSPSDFSYSRWKARPYPTSYDGRWAQMADAAACDEQAALESASWGLFQVMGFHWKELGYKSVQDMAASMVASEAGQLTAMVKFIVANGLAPALQRCKAGNPESCRAFAAGYNGKSYARYGYHIKIAGAL